MKVILIGGQIIFWIAVMYIESQASRKVEYLPDACQIISVTEKQEIVDSVACHFGIKTEGSPYLKIKIECGPTEESYYLLTAYLFHKDKYLFEIRQLKLDDTFHIIEDKNISTR